MRKAKEDLKAEYLSFVDMICGVIGIIVLIVILIAITAPKVENALTIEKFKLPVFEPKNQNIYTIYFSKNIIKVNLSDRDFKEFNIKNKNYKNYALFEKELSIYNDKEIGKSDKRPNRLIYCLYPDGVTNFDFYKSYIDENNLTLNFNYGIILLQKGEDYLVYEKGR